MWVSDLALGARSVETRSAFLAVLQAHSVLAEPGDTQWLTVRAAKDDRSASPAGALLFKPKTILTLEAASAYRASSDSSKTCSNIWYALQSVLRSSSWTIAIDAWDP